jgi:hypothetical protein
VFISSVYSILSLELRHLESFLDSELRPPGVFFQHHGDGVCSRARCEFELLLGTVHRSETCLIDKRPLSMERHMCLFPERRQARW